MSEEKKQKKEIHVRDLVIKADNVTFEGPEVHHDPFFGRRRPVGPHREMEIDAEDDKKKEAVAEEDDKKESDSEEKDPRRPPFFWI